MKRWLAATALPLVWAVTWSLMQRGRLVSASWSGSTPSMPWSVAYYVALALLAVLVGGRLAHRRVGSPWLWALAGLVVASASILPSQFVLAQSLTQAASRAGISTVVVMARWGLQVAGILAAGMCLAWLGGSVAIHWRREHAT